MLRLVINWEDQQDIHRLLDCDLMQIVQLPQAYGSNILWVDESGLLREPFVYPQFGLAGVNGGAPLTGYGLITGYCYEHDAIGPVTIDPAQIPIKYEPWEKRINPDLCIEQLLRLYFDR